MLFFIFTRESVTPFLLHWLNIPTLVVKERYYSVYLTIQWRYPINVTLLVEILLTCDPVLTTSRIWLHDKTWYNDINLFGQRNLSQKGAAMINTNRKRDHAIFRRTASKTKLINVAPKVMRGGIRL